MMTPITNIAFLLSALACVSAHGFIPSITIAGKEYKGNQIGSNNMDSVIRSVTAQDPMYGATNKGLSCGPGSKPAKLTADASPGDEIEFAWTAADGSNWPHNTGPLQTYMAQCDGECKDVDSNSAKWFKIDEEGVNNGQWAQQDLMNGKKSKVTLPSNLAAGDYLIRHEIIALHLADQGRAEFYAGCAQLSVDGSETGLPKSSDLKTFPGTYSDDDPGILINNVYSIGKNSDYTFPGGAVAKLVSSGGGGGDDNSGNNNDDGSNDDDDSSDPAPSSTKTPTSTKTSSSESPTGTSGGNVHLGDGSCKLKRKTKSAKREHIPKRHSRIMRDLASTMHI